MSLADELRHDYFGDLDVDSILEEESLTHYGTPRHSGRYPWGSGDNPYQHVKGFLPQYRELKSQGVKEKDICKKIAVLSRLDFIGIDLAVLKNGELKLIEVNRSPQFKRFVEMYGESPLSEILNI